MDSALTPREIQARIRAGESLDEVAHEAGTSPEQIEPFVAPVLAEREHIAGQALGCPVRRRGESSSARSLRQVVGEHLQRRGVDADEVTWDAWGDPDRRWSVQASFDESGERQVATFGFDARGRFSVARDDLAKALIGEPPPGAASQPSDPDSEPTVDLDDEFALVRATAPRHEPTPNPATSVWDEQEGAEPTVVRRDLTSQPVDVPAQQELDTRNDLVGHDSSQLDMLYDMLSAFDEDSVNIYADLSRPVVDDAAGNESEPEGDEVIVETLDVVMVGDAGTPHEDNHDQPDHTADSPTAPQARAGESAQPDTAEARAGAAPTPLAPEKQDEQRAEPEQDALVEAPEPPAKRKPRARKGRASIPSWDEIMFGGPKHE